MFRAGIPESGILRKHKVLKETLDDLLVFGYACKLFRNDEKALYIDQGKHLIPWMGDETLRIDRYDGRGTLFDLKSCEASREGYDTTRWLGLNESERKVEQLCDEERYYSLTSNEEEELLYKEEELKRQKANEFQYKYDDSPKNNENSNSQSSIPTVEQDDRPYVPRPELDVPVDISIPKTVIENARLEKTAMFVSKQGLQMEILIKAKQANNPQFSFMNQADLLYKYYRHVVAAFKSGRYIMTEYGNTDETIVNTATSMQEPHTTATDPHATTDVHYLHPSLGNASQPPFPPTPSLDPNNTTSVQTALAEQVSTAAPAELTLTYRPRADCAYTQLISRIKGAQQLHKEQQQGYGKEVVEDNPLQQQPQQSDANGGVLTVEQQQQYFQYYYTLRYYDGYKVLGEQYTAQGLDPQLLLQNISIQEQIQQQAVQYAQAALTAYMAQFTNAALPITIVPSAQVSPVDQTPTLTAVGQTVVPGAQAKEIASKAPVVKTLNPLLTLAHYGSDSDEEIEDCDNRDENRENNSTAEHKSSSLSSNQTKFEAYLVPPEDVSVIIDKMAAYVSKNGADFENIVRNRGDPRFEFLKAEHEFHSYYKLKLKEYLGPSAQDNDNITAKKITLDTPTCEASTDGIEQQNGSTATKENDIIEKKLPVPVSFSIKIREESQIEIKLSGLPIEESSDEEEHNVTINSDNQKQLDISANVQNDFDSNQTVKSSNSCIKNAIITKDVTIHNSKSRHLVDSKIVKGAVIDITETGKKNDDNKKRGEKKGLEFSDDDPLLEMIDLTDDFDDKNENSAKKSSHDQQQRALQLERRRKAVAFLRLRSIMEQGNAVENQTTDSKAIATDARQTLIIASGNLTRIKSSGESTGGKEEEGGQCMSSDVVEIIDDSEEDGAETKKDKDRKKSSRTRKSHKRKQSKSSRSRRDGSSSSSSRRKNKKRKTVTSSDGKSKRKIRAPRSRTRSSSKSS